MTSQINPNDINGNYPIAGQPNSTEGMRTNFTNINTNFGYARDEINDLQSKSVLKAALIGTTLDNNMNDNLIYAVKLKDVSYTWFQNTATSGTITIDYSAGQYQYVRTTGSIYLDIKNFPPADTAGVIDITVDIQDPSHTLSIPYQVSYGKTGVQGIVSNTITFTDPGQYQFRFVSTTGNDPGWTIFDLNRPLLGSGQANIGFATGTSAGGLVTQLTNKSTGVTLNKRCGRITMNNASLAAAAEVSFTLTNSYIADTDVVYACIASGATAGAYNLQVDAIGTGSCRISLSNLSSGSLGEAIVINFVVIKSAVN